VSAGRWLRPPSNETSTFSAVWNIPVGAAHRNATDFGLAAAMAASLYGMP
jgi:hypothetical protein